MGGRKCGKESVVESEQLEELDQEQPFMKVDVVNFGKTQGKGTGLALRIS